MNKYFRIIFLSIICSIMLGLPAQAFDPCHPEMEKYKPIETTYKTGLLFKIRKCNLAPSFLLGTMHSDDPKILEKLGIAFAKINYARSAYFEIDFNDPATAPAMRAMYYPQGSIETLQDAVGLELYTRLKTLMAKVYPEMVEETYYRMRPWAVAVMLQEPPKKADGVVLDIRLQNYARGRGLEIGQLETAEEQMKVFEEIPETQQVEFLRDTVENFDRLAVDNQKLFDAYLAGDLNTLQKLADEAFNRISDREFAAKLKIALVDQRNRKMVERMKEKLNKGRAFVAIGALHLTGQNGILNQLEEAGYYIEPVEPEGDYPR